MHHRSHLRGKRVIVAQAELIDGNGIVFVDDGHGTPLQNDLQRIEGVLVPPAVAEIIPREQDLRAHDVMCRKKAGIFLKQQPLPHGSSRLLGRDARWPFCIANAPEACRHRTGSHQNDRVPRFPQCRDLCYNGFNLFGAYAPVRVGQRACADLDRNELVFHSVLSILRFV